MVNPVQQASIVLAPELSAALWRIDATALLLLVLVVGIAGAVVPYAHRSLRGDRHGRAITGAIAVLLAATAVVSIAGPLWVLALAYSAATAATLVALGLGGGAAALRRALPLLIVGDFALWAAVFATVFLGPAAGGDTVALLLVLAAVLRCAVPPAHGWLVDSLHAPTPISAALHGGIVNGGGILVITQYATIAHSPIALTALGVLAALALVLGVLAALVRTDIKGRLVMSTVAQMGFMLLVAALGLTAAALLHLVAHGFYKSALFLSSSDGVDRRAAERRAPLHLAQSPSARRIRLVAGAALPAVGLSVTALALYPGGRGAAELVVLIVMAAAFAAAGARASLLMPSTRSAVLTVALAATAASGFALLTSALTASLAGSPAGVSVVAPPVIVTVAYITLGVLIAIASVRALTPASPLALTLVALGHRLGSPLSPRRGAGRSTSSATESQPSASSGRTAAATRHHGRDTIPIGAPA